MKIIHHDGERLVLEVKSGSLLLKWITFILYTLLWLVSSGGLIAQTRSIRCERLEPQTANCHITDSLFWGAIKWIKNVNNVTGSTIKEGVGESDNSRYPIYRVLLITSNGQQVALTDWERSYSDTDRIKASVEAFLRSDQEFYTFNFRPLGNLWGALSLIFLILINFISYSASPYQVRIIFNRTANEALLIANFFPLGTALKEVTELNSVRLQFKHGEDSDGDTYYQIILILNTPKMSTVKYKMIRNNLYGLFCLKYTFKQQEAENYWQSNPDIQLLKRFIRTEKVTS